jgi:hypothetical protein
MNYIIDSCADKYGEITPGQAARMQALWVEWRQASAFPDPTRTSSKKWRLTSFPNFAVGGGFWYISGTFLQQLIVFANLLYILFSFLYLLFQ